MAIVDVAKMFEIQDVGNHNFVKKDNSEAVRVIWIRFYLQINDVIPDSVEGALLLPVKFNKAANAISKFC